MKNVVICFYGPRCSTITALIGLLVVLHLDHVLQNMYNIYNFTVTVFNCGNGV